VSQPANVLIADDEPLFRESINDFLSAKGYSCSCAEDAPAAERMLSERRYEVFICDIAMPGNSELQLIRDVQKTSPWVPIILVTGYPSLETAIKAVRLPVYSYLLKPVEFNEILPLVEQCAARSRLLQMTASVRDRITNWNAELDQLDGLLGGTRQVPLSESAGILLAGIFEMLIKSLADLGSALAILHATDSILPPSDVSVMESKLKTARQTLREAVEVLEESKNVFKSKRLGEIRKQLQSLLENMAR
jgi:YesN/AraC family two-component response regulator